MSSLIHKLKTTYPDIQFVKAEQFAWSPAEATVFYDPTQRHASALVLHELSHALLNHQQYRRDIELIAMETAAWETATQQAEAFNVRLTDAIVQDHLDTYRDWLHARSTCPECSASGYQTDSHHYSCPACTHQWRVNEARLCALRRYAVTEPTK